MSCRDGVRLRRLPGCSEKDKQSAPVWCLFAVLLLIQLAAAGMLAYEEGDDAFYVAVATGTESSDTLYDILPYTGATTGTDARHGLAPFPVWTAFLARLSGIHPATVNQMFCRWS